MGKKVYCATQTVWYRCGMEAVSCVQWVGRYATGPALWLWHHTETFTGTSSWLVSRLAGHRMCSSLCFAWAEDARYHTVTEEVVTFLTVALLGANLRGAVHVPEQSEEKLACLMTGSYNRCSPAVN